MDVLTPAATIEAALNQVIDEHMVRRSSFFGPERSIQLTAARRDAVRHLHGMGFHLGAIARAVQLNHSTVLYHLSDERRARKIERAKRRWRAIRYPILPIGE